jgi:rhomboid protease GluP
MAFPIRFVSRPQSAWKWVGRGELSTESGQLLLRGRRHRWFLPGKRQEVSIPLGDVVNVAQTATLVRCDVKQAGVLLPLQFRAADAPAAEEIAQLLPRERTPEFAKSQNERDAFHRALDELAPRAVVTPALVAVNVLVFIGTLAAGAGLFQVDGAVLVRLGSNYGPRTFDGEWWRLLTSTFLHFGLLHLVLNMWALWNVGQLTERLLGYGPFLVLYLFAGLCGSLASSYAHPLLNSAGASGAIFGVLGALLALMLDPRTRVPASVSAAQRNSALVFIFYNLVSGLTHSGIDNAAHLGGLCGGFAMSWLLARPIDVETRGEAGPRIAAGILVGSVALLGLSWPLVHPGERVLAERRFTREVLRFLTDVSSMEQDQRSIFELHRGGKIIDAEFGRRIESTLLPRWRDTEQRLEAAAVPEDSRLAPLRSELLVYVAYERRGLELIATGTRASDHAVVEAGTESLHDGEAQVGKVRSLLETLK